ncbi:unnamed protein product [Discula destructiva]
MSGYDYDPPRRERGATRQQYYRDDYAEPADPYLRVQQSHDLVPRGREDSIEEIHRDFPPPGYRRGDVQRTRSAEPYDDYDDARSVYSRRSRAGGAAYDDYDDDYAPRRPRKKTESVYIEEEERKKRRMLSQQEKIIAAVAGAAVALGGKELFDRKEANEHRDDVQRNVLSSAALGAAGAFAAYQGAEFYNKRADKAEKKSTHVIHRGRDGKVTEYYSDDEDEKQKKGHKNFLESALAAAGLGGALKTIMGGGGSDKEKDHHGGSGRDRDRSRDGRGETRSRAGSPGKDKNGGGNKIQKAAMASLIAGATEAFRVSKEPGAWKGEKAKRVLTAAAGAATIDAAQKPGKDGSKLGLAEAVIGGLIGNRMINGSKRDIVEDKETGRSRSRSRARSESRGGKGGGMGLAALATAGLGAIGAKKAVDNIREDRSRSRRRSLSRDSYDSRDESPRRRQRSRSRSRSRSVVDTARRGLAKIGFGKKDDESDVGSRRSGRGGRYSDEDDDYSRDGRGMRGAGRRHDSYDDDRSVARGGRDRSRGAVAKSRTSSRGSVSSSDLGDSDEDEKRAKKMRGKQLLTTGLAAVATIHAAHNVYQSMEKRNARHKAVKAGKLSPEEARKLKSKALLQDAASVGIAALGIKGAVSEMKEAREMSHELAEWREEKETRHQKRLARLERQRKQLEGLSGGNDYYSDAGYASEDEDRRYGNSRRSRADSRVEAGPARRYASEGPRYQDGNPYAAALPAPPVGYADRR